MNQIINSSPLLRVGLGYYQSFLDTSFHRLIPSNRAYGAGWELINPPQFWRVKNEVQITRALHDINNPQPVIITTGGDEPAFVTVSSGLRHYAVAPSLAAGDHFYNFTDNSLVKDMNGINDLWITTDQTITIQLNEATDAGGTAITETLNAGDTFKVTGTRINVLKITTTVTTNVTIYGDD